MGNDNKNIINVEANFMNMYAKLQLHPPYGFWGEDFLIFFRKFTLYVAMATNQIQRFGQNSYLAQEIANWHFLSVEALPSSKFWKSENDPISCTVKKIVMKFCIHIGIM